MARESDKIPSPKDALVFVPSALLLSSLVYSKAKMGHLGHLEVPFIPQGRVSNDQGRVNK